MAHQEHAAPSGDAPDFNPRRHIFQDFPTTPSFESPLNEATISASPATADALREALECAGVLDELLDLQAKWLTRETDLQFKAFLARGMAADAELLGALTEKLGSAASPDGSFAELTLPLVRLPDRTAKLGALLAFAGDQCRRIDESMETARSEGNAEGFALLTPLAEHFAARRGEVAAALGAGAPPGRSFRPPLR